jgi:DNA-directed RNA polymerase specialized sigma24 family protein
MLKSQVVAPHIPFLRRYARALTGSQGAGDAYVAASLEELVKNPALLEAASSPRIALFRLLSNVWNAEPVAGMPDRVLNLMPAEKHLGQMTPKPRQAFLLVSVEGFSEDEAATILNIDRQKLHDLIEEAGRELAAQIATDVLIIEDEVLIALDLEDLVESLGHRVIGIARTRTEALAIASSKRPGLILADIQLADGSSGLEAVNELLNSFQVPVIFITAYPERFLTGERPEPAFLVAKPFQPMTISALVSQALFFERNASRGKRLPAA